MGEQWLVDRAKEYLAKKSLDARQSFYRRNPPLGLFTEAALQSPEHLVYWIQTHIPYTGDGWRIMWSWDQRKWIGCGVPDTYVHPREILWHVGKDSIHGLDIDCDDIMCLYYLGLMEMHVKGRVLPVSSPQCLTLVSKKVQLQFNLPPVYWPTHNVCVSWRYDEQLERFRAGVYDTNGLHWADDLHAAAKMVGDWYRTEYILVPTSYPFFN